MCNEMKIDMDEIMVTIGKMRSEVDRSQPPNIFQLHNLFSKINRPQGNVEELADEMYWEKKITWASKTGIHVMV